MCVPWQCNRAGYSCRRYTAVRSAAAQSHRRDMEWFPPPAPTYLGVCGQDSNAVWAKAGRVWSEEHTHGEGATWQEEVSVVDSPNHGLYLLPVRRVDLVTIFWSHQHGSKAEGRVLQSSTVTFNNWWRQDGNNIYTQRNEISARHFFFKFQWHLSYFYVKRQILCVDSREGNLLILLLTRMSMRAAFMWSPLFTWIYTTQTAFTMSGTLDSCHFYKR